ncbi:MAG: methyltransferase domain-containing protein [Chloroflexi bacterium]|nr:MAG: methyltransferase domain-containing protein [Chloroflexota bacterium]
MTTSTQWQLAAKSAKRYQTILTPAILGPFAHALVDFAAPKKNESVLDIGCGTGAAALYAAKMIGDRGHVTGIDVNSSMLEVARSLTTQEAPIEWREASAMQLPMPNDSVDVVLCAQTLQFLPDKQKSLLEMGRVAKRNGRIAFSLWCDITENPYFDILVNAIATHIGPDTAAGLKSAFALTNSDTIQTLIKEAGLGQFEMTVTQLNLPFSDLASFVPRHISATPMDAGFNQAALTVQQNIIQEIVMKLNRFGENGRIQIPFRSHMIMITA